ncbi:hypothetical protein B0T21DRAFT_414242 [Apiosordaria backusii]|uniref:Autophagy-related protein 29 n=1 Tax=Apiosordaria backusii TaxID=314023 RepID=A0AA40AXP8_9PEZI|nr:hypothetical protein B0T21DRAFT_414242 [Apiosordaria backusii]
MSSDRSGKASEPKGPQLRFIRLPADVDASSAWEPAENDPGPQRLQRPARLQTIVEDDEEGPEEQTPEQFLRELQEMEEQLRQREARAKEPKETKDQASPKQAAEPKYLLYVRLPIKRGDFVDPPLFDWNEEKSEALWDIISDNPRSNANINWTELASRFEVTVEFLLQMANYLTDRHANQIRAQMLKAATGRGSAAPSPIPGAEPSSNITIYPQASEPLRRTGSASGRAPSSNEGPSAPLSRNDAGYASNVGAGPSTTKPTNIPVRPAVSRNSSAGTAISTQNPLGIRPAPSVTSNRAAGRYISSFLHQERAGTDQDDASTIGAAQHSASASPATSDSEEESDSDDSPVQSRIIRRPPRFSVHDHRAGFDGLTEDEEEPEPAFLPPQHQQQMDMGATLRGVPGGGVLIGGGGRGAGELSQTSDSSASSAAIVHHPGTALVAGGGRYPAGGAGGGVGGQGHIHGTLSPRSRTAELRDKGKGVSREGSDGTGTPSMGSSFSDLDDASVTQSALEEALASRMQDGTIGSRMSVIGHAIKSRYLPKSPKSPEGKR